MKKFIDDYFADENGNLYSFKFNKQRKLRFYINSKGYKMYRVSINGKVKQFSAHHISYYVNVESFSTKDGLEIDHIDGNKLNNHFSNLRRVTSKVNQNNPNTKTFGRTPKNKLNISEDDCRLLFEKGWSKNDIAKHFNCSRTTVKNRL